MKTNVQCVTQSSFGCEWSGCEFCGVIWFHIPFIILIPTQYDCMSERCRLITPLTYPQHSQPASRRRNRQPVRLYQTGVLDLYHPWAILPFEISDRRRRKFGGLFLLATLVLFHFGQQQADGISRVSVWCGAFGCSVPRGFLKYLKNVTPNRWQICGKYWRSSCESSRVYRKSLVDSTK